MFANKTVYVLNSAAIGDLIAAAPTLKHAIDAYHDKTEYLVAIYDDFKDIFPFVPDDKFIPINSSYPVDFSIRTLNPPKNATGVCKLTPSRMKLTEYGCVNLMGKILSDIELKYIPLKTVNVDRFNVDFSKSVIIITTYRDKQRTILSNELLTIAQYIQSKGLIPVYVGKTGKISIWKDYPAISDFEYPGFGVDLRDQTTLCELASIMSKSRAVIGMDSGPIHIAFTTDTPVIAGFTTVAPSKRIPYRGLAKTIAITPNIFCNFCESDWNLNLWDFNHCPRKMQLAECVTKMTAVKFINAMNELNVF
jgi:ADP-heptose:LPS heptosyltransferase